MKVVVGSSDLWPTPALASAILVLMLSSDEHQWAVRANQHGTPSSPTEELALRIGDRLGKTVVKHYAHPAPRTGAFKRDNTMVGMANEVFAFFAADYMAGGTGHVVSVALRVGLPVTTYAINDAGDIVEAASDEGHFNQLQGW